jgi:glycosyltransferase involved in cell wall biosynthesis
MVDIIIVTYNRIKYFKTSIEFLYRSTKHPFNIIAVDNGSKDGTREYILEMEKKGLVWKHVFNKENLPLSKAFTKGFKVSKSEFVVIADDDLVVSPNLKHDWLDIFVRKMEDDESVGCINFTGCRCNYNKFIKKYG